MLATQRTSPFGTAQGCCWPGSKCSLVTPPRKHRKASLASKSLCGDLGTTASDRLHMVWIGAMGQPLHISALTFQITFSHHAVKPLWVCTVRGHYSSSSCRCCCCCCCVPDLTFIYLIWTHLTLTPGKGQRQHTCTYMCNTVPVSLLELCPAPAILRAVILHSLFPHSVNLPVFPSLEEPLIPPSSPPYSQGSVICKLWALLRHWVSVSDRV